MWKKLAKKLLENKVDANNPVLNMILYCTNFEKEHEESIENGIKDQETAEKALTKKTNGERLEPWQAQAINIIKKKLTDVFFWILNTFNFLSLHSV